MKWIIIPFLYFFVTSCSKENYTIYQWRGPDRSGIYPDTGLLKAWPEEGPEELRTIEGLGNGFSSPVFTEDRFYITGEKDSVAWLYCYDLAGVKQWETALGPEWVTSFPGSRSAPTIAGDRIYVGTGKGDLYCLGKDSGELQWRRSFSEDFQGQYPLHGHSESALMYRDRVFWTPGGKENNVVALDRMTGELIWSHPGFSERSAYHPPRLILHNGRPILVTFSAYHLMGFDAETGEMLWSHEQDNLPLEERKLGYGDTHANTTLYEDGGIYYAAGDGNGGVKLQLSKDGSGIGEVWRNPGFDSFMGGIVRFGDFLYGAGTKNRYLKALNRHSGEWTDSLEIGTGAVIAADSMLYFYNWRGILHLVQPKDGQLKEISSFRITKGTKQHFSHPVIHRGILYLRRGDVLMAFRVDNNPEIKP